MLPHSVVHIRVYTERSRWHAVLPSAVTRLVSLEAGYFGPVGFWGTVCTGFVQEVGIRFGEPSIDPRLVDDKPLVSV